MAIFEETLRYLGWRGQELDDPLRAGVEAAIREAEALAVPRSVWRIFPLRGNVAEGTGLVLPGESMKAALAGARAIALMAATLGRILDSAISRHSRFDVSHALLLDAAAAALIEVACDQAASQIGEEAARRGLAAQPRFSPGYGDFPLELQAKLLAVLDAERRLGLTATPNHLLLPRKSVTAAIPLLPRDQESIITAACSGCEGGGSCPYPACIRRK